MRWSPTGRDNIDDLRGRSGMRGGGMSLGIGGVLVLLVLSWATGTDFLSLLGGGGGPAVSDSTNPGAPVQSTPAEERQVDFMNTVVEDAQSTWEQILGSRYQRTRLAVFRDAVQSACGFAEAATGPFYCPGDKRVYLDLGFFDELAKRFGAPGDFAQAYVIAHEIGHHVQNLTGITARVEQDRRPGANSASVALELQADCFAGIWGHAASQSGRFQAGHVELDPGDADEALRAAAAIGDDRLQKMGGGRVTPERFTHGTSQQRVEWFKRGMDSGKPDSCNTFASMSN
jgi:predicted metalloprotease